MHLNGHPPVLPTEDHGTPYTNPSMAVLNTLEIITFCRSRILCIHRNSMSQIPLPYTPISIWLMCRQFPLKPLRYTMPTVVQAHWTIQSHSVSRYTKICRIPWSANRQTAAIQTTISNHWVLITIPWHQHLQSIQQPSIPWSYQRKQVLLRFLQVRSTKTLPYPEQEKSVCQRVRIQ